MKKICVALIGSAVAMAAAPAIASTIVAGPFETRGECHSWVPWKNGDDAKGWKAAFPDLSNLQCHQVAGKWFVLAD